MKDSVKLINGQNIKLKAFRNNQLQGKALALEKQKTQGLILLVLSFSSPNRCLSFHPHHHHQDQRSLHRNRLDY